MTNYEMGVVFKNNDPDTLKTVYNTLMHSLNPDKYSETDMPFIPVYKPRKSQINPSEECKTEQTQ